MFRSICQEVLFFSYLCFEKNIIESYPGEKGEIKGMIDILIRRSFTPTATTINDRDLDLEGEKETVSIEKR